MVEARDNGNSKSGATDRKIRVNVFGRTDVGMVREHNEDSFLVADLSCKNRSIQPEVQNHVIGELGSVFAVCDGMGGAAAGEVASKLGVDTIYEVLQAGEPPVDESELAIRLNEAICEAGSRIYAESKANSARRGMGTTATVAVLMNERLLFGQVGDSRAHIIRKGKLVQTTKDQSLVQQLIDANQLTPEEAKNFDRSNIILQALGTSEEVHVDITSTLLRRGDILVICSDGLSGMVEPEDIRDVVLAIEDPSEACQKLTQMACDNGGDDNITVIIAKFDGEGLDKPALGDEVAYEKFMLPGLDDEDSITLPRGMPAIPGSAARSGYNGRSREEQARGKLPFFILLAFMTLAGMVLFFTWNSNQSASYSSNSTAASGVESTPSRTASASGKAPSGDVDADMPDVGNAILLAQETDMDFLGDTDPVPDSGLEAETDGLDSASDAMPAADDQSTDMDAVADKGGVAPGTDLPSDSSAEKNQVPESIDSSLQTARITAGVDSNAGKWARGKAKRKRKSEQELSSDASGYDSDASSEDSGEAIQEADVQTLSEETDMPPVDTSADETANEAESPMVEKAVDTANVRQTDSAPSASVSDENPY